MMSLARPATRLVFLALLLLVAAGCASSGENQVRGPSDHITNEELRHWQERGVRDMAQLVELARPRWLRAPSGQRSVYGASNAVIVVFRDHRYMGGLDQLDNMALTGVVELRWLGAAEADALPGTGNMHVHGAIMIITTASGATGSTGSGDPAPRSQR